MDTGKPGGISKQGLRPQDQDTIMELDKTNRDDLRRAHKGPSNTPDWEIEIYMYKRIRMMMGPNWEIEARYPEKGQLYKKQKQSPMESWLSKNKKHDKDDAYARQSDDTSKSTQRNVNTEEGATKQWKLRNQSILAQTCKKQEKLKGRQSESYVKRTGGRNNAVRI